MDVKQRKSERQQKKTLSQENREKTKSSGAFLERFLWGLSYALLGTVLGGAALPFGATPFGIALLCGADRRTLYVWVGLALRAWRSEERVFLLGLYTALLAVRALSALLLESESRREHTFGELWQGLFEERIALRAATAGLGAFALGLYRLYTGGYLYYDLYGALISIVVAAGGVLLIAPLFKKEREEVGTYRKNTALLALGAATFYALGVKSVYGISLAVLGCMLLALYIARKQGVIWGTVFGLVGGLSVSVSLAPAFAFGALAAGLLFSASPFLAVSCAFAASTAWSIHVRGIGVINGILPALIAAAVLFSVIDKLFFREKALEKDETTEQWEDDASQSERVSCEPISEQSLQGIRAGDTQGRVKGLCEGLSSLSGALVRAGQKLRTPTEDDLLGICDRAFDNACVSCSGRELCHSRESSVSTEELGSLSLALQRRGRIENEDVEASLRERCARLPDVLEEINQRSMSYRQAALWNDHTEIFAADYAALSRILASAMVEQEEEYRVDGERTKELCEALDKLGLGLCGAAVFGTRRKRILLRGNGDGAIWRERERILETVQASCGFAVSVAEDEEEQNALLLIENETLSVSYATASMLAKGEEEFCGDACAQFFDKEGRFYALISDGMGSGREASLASGLGKTVLEALLRDGNDCEAVLSMLNVFLKNRESGSLHECSVTVDLMELDLVNKKAGFYKSGAAPTYVFREGSLFKLRSRTLPMGILSDPDIRRIRFDVGEGDVIVMVSDGVTQGREECPWLFDLLQAGGEERSARSLAELILKYAKGQGCTDDVTVQVIKVGPHKKAS